VMAMRAVLRLLPLALAWGELSDLPLSSDDQCQSGAEDCALQALQHHAKAETSEVDSASTASAASASSAASTASTASTASANSVTKVSEEQEKGGQSKVEKQQSIFDCKKDTGGTCSWFGCSKSRGADCKDGKCQCGANLCARNGKCQIAEGYKMAKTTLQERDTGGSCRFFACDESRGPTHCDRNQGYKCFCAEGFFSTKGQCIPKLVSTNPSQGQPAQPFDWTKVDWSKVFQKNGWGVTTDWSKIDWNKIYGGGATPGAPGTLGGGYGYGLPYGAPATGMPPYAPANPYAYANPYGVPYWR